MGQEHSATMLNLTGDLWPAPETPDTVLDLRKAILGALRSGQNPLDIGPRGFTGEPASGAEEEIRDLGDGPLPPSNMRLRRRTTAVPAADPLIGGPVWATGQRSTSTLGPFQDRGGRLHWFDVFAPVRFFRIFIQGDPEPIALLPFGTAPGNGVFNVPAGSLWLRASMMGAGIPTATWVGLRIKSATGTPGGPVQVTPGGVLLRPGAGIQCALTLDTGDLAGFPATTTVSISPNGIRIMGLAAGSATAFGTTVSFPAAGGVPATFDNLLRAVVLPLAPAADRFAALDAPLSGEAGIHTASWALPLTQAPAASLGDAEAPGWVALSLDPGLNVDIPGVDGGPVSLGRCFVLASPAGTTLFAPDAVNPLARQTLEAWFEDRVERRSSFELRWPSPFPFWFFRLPAGAEAEVTRGELTFHTDRPVRASGERLESRIPVRHLLERDADGARVTLIGSQPIDVSRRFAMALSNALLTVAEPNALELFAKLHNAVEAESGAVQFRLPLFQLLPALPDPYAANFEPRVTDHPDNNTRLLVSVIWTEPFAAQLDLRLDPPPFNMYSTLSVLPPEKDFRPLDELTGRFSGTVPQIGYRGLSLVDVSTNAAQFGVVLGYNDRPGAGLAIRDLTLNIHGSNVMVFMLPQFQWEPVFNQFNKNVPSDPPGWQVSSNDGGPTQAAADLVRLVPVRPLRVLDEIAAAYTEEQRNAAILFTLPFGIRALAQLNPLDRNFSRLPQLQVTSPRFDGMDGAPQLTLVAGTKRDGQVWISGQATAVPTPETSPLGSVIGPEFHKAFLTGVPVDRIGFCGYGATLFSRWVLAKDDPIGITQVAIDAFHGRASYERILMTTILIPCFSRMVRTVTFERHGGGVVVRSDSGWLSTTPGLFEYAGRPSHKCAVTGLYNIREVRDTNHIVTVNGKTLQAVYFDADVAMDNVVRGAGRDGRVPARRHLGFIQLLTIPKNPPPGPISEPLLDIGRICQLLDQEGPVGGPLDCEIRVGDSQHTMKVTSLLAANIDNTRFSVGPVGIPSLAGPGQWSVAKVTNASGAVEPLPRTQGIPLVRASGGAFRWAEPKDLFQNNPASDYAFLFSSGAQRILFPRPKVEPAENRITSKAPPLLADPYALLKSSGLFPAPKQAIPFANPNWGLESVGGALRLEPSPFTVTAAPTSFNLLKTGTWWTDFSYSNWDKEKQIAGDATKFVIDSAADWAIDATPVRQSVNFPGVGEIMQIVHKMQAPTSGDDQFPDPEVVFAPLLEQVTDVLRALREWAPNLPEPLKVDASFSGSTFRLSAVADFNIEDKDGNAIDCGMGKLKGALKIGAELSVEVFKRTTNGAVFFEITGSWQQEVFPELYGGGLLRFKIRADNDGQTTLELDACVTGSIGGDLIPGLVSVEATVKYGYFLFTNPIMPGFMAGIEGRAKLLDGFLGFKFGVEGRVGITRTTHNLLDLKHICNLHGEIQVAGTVTVAWLVEERKSFRTQFDVNVDWKMLLLAAKMGLLPVP